MVQVIKMEKLSDIKNIYGCKDPKELSPLVLAYIGDAVFEIFVRSKVLFEFGNAPVNKMHKRSREMVKAKGQSDMYKIY